MVEWETVDALILDLVSVQVLDQGGKRAREEEAWLRRRERFDGMMAKERDKVTRRKLTKALVEVEEEMDSIMSQMFGSKMEGKKESDLGISSSQNCAAEDLSRQDSLQGKMEEERKRCSRVHAQGVSGERKKDAKPTSSTAALLKEVKEASARKKKPRMVNELQRRNTSRNKGA